MEWNQLKSQYAKTDQWVGKHVKTKHLWIMNAAATTMASISTNLETTACVFVAMLLGTFIFGHALDKDKKKLETK